MADTSLDETALRGAREQYMHDAYRLTLEAKKLDMAGYPLTAEVCRKKAERCRRAAAAELVNPR